MAVILHQLKRSLAPKICSSSLSLPCLKPLTVLPTRSINYASTVMPDLEEHGAMEKPKTRHWLEYNDKIFPPTQPGEEPRPAYVCHMKENLKYSPKKMWYIACFVRGMSVEEALKQLDFVNRKGAVMVKETILEAQQLAVDKHNVEFKSNLWIAESFAAKGAVVKGMRRHARKRYGTVEYKYCHYFVRLEEGKPPENYYQKQIRNKENLLNYWLDKMHKRRVVNSL